MQVANLLGKSMFLVWLKPSSINPEKFNITNCMFWWLVCYSCCNKDPQALSKREKWEGYILFVRHLILVPDCCFCVMVQLRSMSKSKCFLYSCLPCDCLSDCKAFGARTKWRKDPSSATRGKKKASGGWAQTSGRRKRESAGSAEKRKGTEGETTEQSSEQENGCSSSKQRRNGALSVWLAENC